MGLPREVEQNRRHLWIASHAFQCRAPDADVEKAPDKLHAHLIDCLACAASAYKVQLRLYHGDDVVGRNIPQNLLPPAGPPHPDLINLGRLPQSKMDGQHILR